MSEKPENEPEGRYWGIVPGNDKRWAIYDQGGGWYLAVDISSAVSTRERITGEQLSQAVLAAREL